MSLFDGDLSVALTRLTKSFGNNELDIAYTTRNTRPFSDQKYPYLVNSVQKYITSKECIRSSKHLVETLKEIIDDCLVESLQHCWRMQSVKSRLDCLMKLTIPFVVTPHLTSLIGGEIGRTGDNDITFLQKTQEIIIEIFTYFIDSEQLVYETGSDAKLDNARTNLIISLLIFKRSSFSFLNVLVREYAPEGLIYLSQHLLGVSALCEDVIEAIQSLTTRLCTVIGEDFIMKQKNEAKSNVSPNDSISPNQHLQNLHKFILDYFQWLRTHKNSLIKLSRVVEVIHCVHPSLRHSLQNETYNSGFEIISKYQEKYKEHLTMIHLPQQTFRRDDVLQALKDANREEIIVNGQIIEGGNFILELMAIIRNVFLLNQNYNDKIENSSSPQNIDVSIEEVYQKIYEKKENNENNLLRDLEVNGIGKDNNSNINNSNEYFIDFIELLTRFIVIAVSRTYASGDAFFVLEDLYGGEGLCIRGKNGFDKKRNICINKKTKVKITLGYVLIHLHQSYDLYLAESIGSEESMIKPLISFETKVDTLITLTPNPQLVSNQPTIEQLREMFLSLSVTPEKICHRLLTIQPIQIQKK